MNDEAMKADDHAPDYRKAMLFHSDRADHYAAERDAAIARAEAAETALAAERAKVARIEKAWPLVRDNDCTGGELAWAIDEIEDALSEAEARDE